MAVAATTPFIKAFIKEDERNEWMLSITEAAANRPRVVLLGDWTYYPTRLHAGGAATSWRHGWPGDSDRRKVASAHPGG